MDQLKQEIYATVQSVVEEEGIDVSEIHDHDALGDDLGLRSIDIARIIAILELQLAVDPFAELVPITSVRTVGDLWAAYAKCFSQKKGAEEGHLEDGPGSLEQKRTQTPRRQRTSGTRQRELRKKSRRNVSS